LSKKKSKMGKRKSKFGQGLVPIVWRCSKAHSGILLCLCHLYSVPCHVPSSMTLSISLEDQNQVIYPIDKFALYPFPPFFQPILIVQNPVKLPGTL